MRILGCDIKLKYAIKSIKFKAPFLALMLLPLGLSISNIVQAYTYGTVVTKVTSIIALSTLVLLAGLILFDKGINE
jgi:hypothetical protein